MSHIIVRPHPEDLASASGRRAYAVVWKEDGTSRFQDWLLSFGLSATEEEAMGKVELAQKYGVRGFSVEEFWQKTDGGVFYPIGTHFGVPARRNG